MRLRRVLVGALLAALAPFYAVAPVSALTNADKMKLAEKLNKQRLRRLAATLSFMQLLRRLAGH